VETNEVVGREIGLQELAIAKSKAARRIQYLFDNPRFVGKVDAASSSEQKILRDAISRNDIEWLLNWDRKTEANELEDLTVKQLRTKARSMYIQHWNYLDKASLIREIIRERASYDELTASGDDEGGLDAGKGS